MTIASLLLPALDQELATARRFLERVPDDKLGWRPHLKSMTLGRLATHVAELPSWISFALCQDALDVMPEGRPIESWPVVPNTAELLAQFDRLAGKARETLAGAGDELFSEPWTLKVAGTDIWTKPRYEVYAVMAMHHLVHHRAQLGVYLRLLDVPVPCSYGPSADEEPGA